MNDELFTEVSKYIDDNILQSVLWDSSADTVKRKAANNAYESLARLLPDVFAD